MSKTTPQVIQGVDLHINGYGYAGRALEVVLPSITETTAEHRGGTMAAPRKIALGYEALDATIKVAEFDLAPAALKILTGADTNAIVLMNSNLRDGGSVKALKAVMAGRIINTEKPAAKPGTPVEITYTLNCTAYALTVDDVPFEAINIETGQVTFGENEVWGSITNALGI